MLRYVLIFMTFSFFSFANIPSPFNKQANILGAFSFTITDFNLQVGGLPVQVNRTYSTLQRFDKLDFIYAWSIDYENVKLEENIHSGREWKTTSDTLIGSCFKTDKQQSLSDGTTESFCHVHSSTTSKPQINDCFFKEFQSFISNV